MTKSIGLASIAALLNSPGWAQTPVPQEGAFLFGVTVAGTNLHIPYDANRSVGVTSPSTRRAVVLLPGSSRNSMSAYHTVVDAATIAHMNDASSLLVSPQFLIELDLTTHQLPPDRLFWTDNGWKQGDRSSSTGTHPRPGTISSFAVLDSLLHEIATRNPNLESIVVGGHSAGAQFTNRYAAGSTIVQDLQTQFGVMVSFAAANPSSYLYFNARRAVAPSVNQFAIPATSAIANCPGYDDYKYGLQARNNYMSRRSASEILAQFPHQAVTYLLGELDNDPAGVDLDTTCEAQMQGAHRLERGTIYSHHLRDAFGPATAATQHLRVVAGVGHDSRAMFTSPCGVDALFGGSRCDQAVDVPGHDAGGVAAAECSFGAVQPNPFRDRVSIEYFVGHGGRAVSLRVFDVRGHRLRTVFEGSRRAGQAHAVWDGRTDAGIAVPAGVYIFQLRQTRVVRTHRVTILR